MNLLTTAIENEIKNAISSEIGQQLDGLYTLLNELKQKMESSATSKEDYNYFSSGEVMKLLKIGSETTLAKYRNKGTIKYKRLGNGTYIYPAKQFKYDS